MPSRLPPHIREKLEPIRLLVLDVDGVLTDGTLIYTGSGEDAKAFNVHDGLGIRLLVEGGISVGVITGRSSPAVTARCADLGFPEQLVILGSRDKSADLDRMLAAVGVGESELAVMGDDLPDLPMLGRANLAFCPADAAPEVVAICDHVCGRRGGRGAVREAAELLLKAQGKWAGLVAAWPGTERKAR